MLNALLWNLLATAVLAIALAALCHLPLLHKRPALVHWLWLLLLAKLVTPSLVALPLLPATTQNNAIVSAKSPNVPPPSGANAALTAETPEVAEAASLPAARPSTWRIPPLRTLLLPSLAAVSLFGTCLMLMLHAIRVVKFHRWLRRAGVEAPALSQACADVASQMKIRAGVRCRLVDARTTPLLWGWRHPLIVVPRQLFDEVAPQQLRSILAHELAHLVRRDHWANLYVALVKAILWWNPVVWWADREIRAAQELCCDAMAIDRCDASRRSYAATLLKTIDFVQIDPCVPRALAPGMGSKQSVFQRFKMLGEKRLSYRLTRWTLLILLLIAIPIVGIRVGCKRYVKPQEGDVFPEAARPAGNCSISGKVVTENGRPVAGGRMYMHYNVTNGSIFINTASDGTFEVKNIPKGPFSLKLSLSPGYQDVAYNPDNKPGKYPEFSLNEGEHRSGIVLTAKAACRISGKVVDESGKPPKEVDILMVLAWVENTEDGPKGANEEKYHSRQAQVNQDDGSYVIDGLADKPAYVMAIGRSAAFESQAFPPIYYPGVFSRSDAKPITFEKSKSVENVNFALRKKGGIVLEGTVTDEAGMPVPEALVVVHHRDMLFDYSTARTDQQGRYEIQGLGDGQLQVHVDATHRGLVRVRFPIDLGKSPERLRRDFTLTRGARISGKFVDQDGQPWDIGESSGNAWVEGTTLGQNRRYGTFSTTCSSNVNNVHRRVSREFSLGEGPYENAAMSFPTMSTFFVESIMPGTTRLTFSPNKEKQEVVQILYNGQDILESGLVTKPGEEIKDVTIVIGPARTRPPVTAEVGK